MLADYRCENYELYVLWGVYRIWGVQMVRHEPSLGDSTNIFKTQLFLCHELLIFYYYVLIND